MGTNTLSTRLGIGGLSQLTGCNIETIRYYERIGLLPDASRSAGRHRQYGEAQVRRLRFIRRSRELGFTLDQVRTLLKLVDGGRYTCAQVKRITIHHLDEVHRKVADLQKIERVLREMAAQCDGGTVPKCPVIDALFDPGADTASASIRTSSGRANASPRNSDTRGFARTAVADRRLQGT
jgi:MerR family mercuric resistance operon transcriptional regulator